MACVDSSIGGKTAVNVQQGSVQLKNIIGTFHPPSRVYIDIACIAALPQRHFNNGMAEVVKCAVLASPRLYALLSCSSPARIQAHPTVLAHVMCVARLLVSVCYCNIMRISAAIDIKASVVAEDPTEVTRCCSCARAL
jgi:3-dehydroquinate synthetase